MIIIVRSWLDNISDKHNLFLNRTDINPHVIHLFCCFCFYTRDVIQVWKPLCDFCRLSGARWTDCIWPLSLLFLTVCPPASSPAALLTNNLNAALPPQPTLIPLPHSSSLLPPFLLFLLAAQSENRPENLPENPHRPRVESCTPKLFRPMAFHSPVFSIPNTLSSLIWNARLQTSLFSLL